MNRTLTLTALVVVALLLGAVAYATADTAIVNGTGAPETANDTVTVSVAVNPKLTLQITTPAASQTVDFGAANPATTYGPQTVTLVVQSNKTYDVSNTVTGGAAIGLTTTLGASTNNARTAGQSYADNYSINVPWTTAPGPQTATVQYSVVQN